MNNRPNGHSRLKLDLTAVLNKPMTPEERVLWMAKQNLPPGYALLHNSEVEAIAQGLQAEHRQRVALQAQLEELKKAAAKLAEIANRRLSDIAHYIEEGLLIPGEEYTVQMTADRATIDNLSKPAP